LSRKIFRLYSVILCRLCFQTIRQGSLTLSFELNYTISLLEQLVLPPLLGFAMNILHCIKLCRVSGSFQTISNDKYWPYLTLYIRYRVQHKYSIITVFQIGLLYQFKKQNSTIWTFSIKRLHHRFKFCFVPASYIYLLCLLRVGDMFTFIYFTSHEGGSIASSCKCDVM
jgi:hypothetical protein